MWQKISHLDLEYENIGVREFSQNAIGIGNKYNIENGIFWYKKLTLVGIGINLMPITALWNVDHYSIIPIPIRSDNNVKIP